MLLSSASLASYSVARRTKQDIGSHWDFYKCYTKCAIMQLHVTAAAANATAALPLLLLASGNGERESEWKRGSIEKVDS